MRSSLSLIFTVAITAAPTLAWGYCRTTTCAQQDPPLECVPGQVIGSCQKAGKALKWPSACVSFSVQKDGSKRLGITADELEGIVRTSFDNWQNATCADGGTPNVIIQTFAQVDCMESRYNQNDGNQNVWLFRDEEWPHEGGGDRTIALTLVSFSPKTGEIYDVDVELNSFSRHFKLETTGTGDDLPSVVQHESGHFLGLAHSDVGDATMWSNYSGSIDMRTLDDDDIAGICAIYPSTGTKDAKCDATPRHGFSTQCSSPDDGCSISHPGKPTPGRYGALLALGLGIILTSRARRRAQRLAAGPTLGGGPNA